MNPKKLFQPPKGADLVIHASAVKKKINMVFFSSFRQTPGLGRGTLDLVFTFLLSHSQIKTTMVIEIGTPTFIHSKNEISTPLIVS